MTIPTPKTRKILRYNNRKMYDQKDSRHISVAELYDLLRKGYPFEVSKAATGEDMTSYVLCMMLYNMARKGVQFPTDRLLDVLAQGQGVAAI